MEEESMADLFEPTTINGMQLKNRFVRSATWEGMARPDGACTYSLIKLMTELAEGDVGLIVTGHTYVEKRGQATPGQLGIYDDQLMPGLEQLAGAVHDRGGKIVLQLAHAGLFADTTLT
jgi:2,4-dienoyl-CoA reductase-like NADH-dependent reductase (Old Yellow Enzyme family)